MTFREFCAALYKEEYGTDIPDWQLDTLDYCYEHRHEMLWPTRGDGKSMTKLTILTLITMYNEMEGKENG